MKFLGLTLPFIVCMATLVGPTAIAYGQTDAAASYEDIRNQGVHYFKKRRYKQAYQQLRRAYSMKEASEDFVVTFYLAQTAAKLLLLERAFDLSEKAQQLAGDNERRKNRANEFADELGAVFGKVTMKAAPGETNAQGRIFFETKTGIINKRKRKQFMTIRERFRSTDVSLPTTVYLPYGEYLANKVPFTIKEGVDPETVEIYLQVKVQATNRKWLWIGLGTAALVAVGTGVGVYAMAEGQEAEDLQRWFSGETQSR